jgi:hypothetical protein
MKTVVYPYARNNTVLDPIALRLAGADAGFNARADRLEVIPPEHGEAIRLEARIDVDVPTVFNHPLVPEGQPVTLLAVARCRDTRWARTIREWSIPVNPPRKRFTPNPEPLTIDSGHVSGQFRVVFCLCLASDRTAGGSSFARRRWNIIAEKRFTVLMSGAGGSITEWVSFRERNLPHGLWYLNVPGGNLDQPAPDLRIYLNKDIEPFRRLLSSTSATRPERVLAHTLTRRMIRAAFINGMLSLAFSTPNNDIPEDEESWGGSCWGVAFGLCRQVFPDRWDADDPIASFRELREHYATRLNTLETCVQAFAELPQTLERSHTLNPLGAS